MPRILAQYLSAAILKHYFLLTAVTLVVASLIEFLENRDGLMDDPAVTMAAIVKFSILSAPGIFSRLAGFIALVSVLIASITLLRYSELKAILASGLSYGQLLSTLLPAAIAMAGFHFCMDNMALPRATAALRDLGAGNEAHKLLGETDAIWVRQGNYILTAGSLHERTRSLAGVELFALNQSGRMAWHLAGDTARFSGGDLIFPDAVRTVPGRARAVSERGVRFATPIDFDIVAALALHPRHTSAWQIARVLDQTSAVSHPRYVYTLWLHRKLSGPITTALVALLLAPLLQVAHRISGPHLLLMGLAAGFVCFVTDAVLTGLAEGGVVSPVAAAWALAGLLALTVISPLLTSGTAGKPAPH